MGLFVKQAEIKDKKKNNDYRENPEKYGLLLGQAGEERKCEYVGHYGQIIGTALEKPLASKNRILDSAQFQNYKYIFIRKTSELRFLTARWILNGAVLTGALDKEIDLLGDVSLWQFHQRNLHIQAVGLTASGALEMHVLMAMTRGKTFLRTEGIL
jgi:hypothetical protein